MSIALSHLLLTNDVPSTSETVAIQRIVDDSTLLLRYLQSKLEPFKIILSPLRRVPPEILGEILWWTLPEHTESEGLSKEDRNCLLNLCRISKKWRDAALSTHRLWAYVCITLERIEGAEDDDDEDEDEDEDDGEHKKDQFVAPILSGLRAWFGRAGKVPKTLRVYIEHYPVEVEFDETCKEYCLAAFLKLVSFILEENWGHLHLYFPSIHCFELLMTTIDQHPHKAAWKSLRSLTIAADDWEILHPHFEPLAFLPPVTTLSLQCPNYRSEDIPDMGNVSLAKREQLVNLHLEIVWYEDYVFDFLDSCKNLESCHLSFTSFPDVWEINFLGLPRMASSHCIDLPKLHTLHLTTAYPTDVLRRLTLPSLHSLTITTDSPNFEAHYLKNIKILPLFISRSQCQLENLHLSLLKISGENLWEILPSFPSVVHLTLEKINFNGSMFREMKHPKMPFKKLETIRLIEMSPDFDVGAFSSFVDHWNGKAVLKRGSATYYDPLTSIQIFEKHL